MNDEYLRMILALPDEFFEGWEWTAGDKALVNNEIWTVFGGNTNGMVVIGENLQQFSIGNLDFSYKIGDKARPIPSQEQLQKIYKTKKDIQFESLALLWLANWLEDKVTEDHGLCLKHISAEAIALLWVQETCYGKRWGGQKWI